MNSPDPMLLLADASNPPLSHTLVVEGDAPHRKFTNRWEHRDGVRTFDGKTWRAYPRDPATKVIDNTPLLY